MFVLFSNAFIGVKRLKSYDAVWRAEVEG